jgi:anti-sigma factor RsiW
MKPQVVGSACQRVQMFLDESLATGAMSLPPELAAHAAQCPHCVTEVRETESLLTRLRDAAAGVDLGRVPQVVDYVLSQTTVGPQFRGPATAALSADERRKRVRATWVLGQVAAVAAVLLLAVGSLTFLALKVNQAVSGVSPSDVIQRIAAPFSQTNRAEIRQAK